MMRDVLLALGLLFSTATQLRLPGIPIAFGPGEILLSTWILLAIIDTAFRRTPPLSPALSYLLVFWAVFAFAQYVGLFVGLAIEHVRDTVGAWHTAKAYVLVGTLSCLILAMPETKARLRQINRAFVIAGAISLSVLIASGFGLFRIPGLDLWWYTRFLGWTTNPNQLALLCTVLVLLSVHIAETEAKLSTRYFGLLCAVPAFVAGILTRSDSFVLAMLIAGPMYIGIRLLTWVSSAMSQSSLRSNFACLILLSVPAILVLAVPFTPKVLEKAQQVAIETMEHNDQAEGRFRLWRDAIDVGLEAGMLGLGPGPHLITKQWKNPPPEKNEAHNTLLDLFTQGGLLASLSFLWITGMALLSTYRAKFIGLTALVLSLFIFSNFHLIIRHPIFWFSIAFCLTATEFIPRVKTTRDGARHDRAIRPHPPRPA